MPTPYDIAAALLFAVALPVYGTLSFKRLLERLKTEGSALRIRAYHMSTVTQWVLCVLVLAIWFAFERAPKDIGFYAPMTLRFWGGIAIAILVTAILLYQVVMVRRSADQRQQMLEEMDRLMPFLPHSKADLRAFIPLAITAGVVEEILFRGYLIWLLSQWMNIAAASAFALILFTAAHAYQGSRGMIRVALMGLVLTGVFLLSRSLIPAILLHISADLIGGVMSKMAVTRENVDEMAGAREATA